MVFGGNWTQVGPKFLSERLVVSGLVTTHSEQDKWMLKRQSKSKPHPLQMGVKCRICFDDSLF